MSKIEDRVCEKIQSRAAVGLKKYGVTCERTDFTLLDWLENAQMESMDHCIYLEAAIQKLKKEQLK